MIDSDASPTLWASSAACVSCACGIRLAALGRFEHGLVDATVASVLLGTDAVASFGFCDDTISSRVGNSGDDDRAKKAETRRLSVTGDELMRKTFVDMVRRGNWRWVRQAHFSKTDRNRVTS
jgi:hypothetical protein